MVFLSCESIRPKKAAIEYIRRWQVILQNACFAATSIFRTGCDEGRDRVTGFYFPPLPREGGGS